MFVFPPPVFSASSSIFPVSAQSRPVEIGSPSMMVPPLLLHDGENSLLRDTMIASGSSLRVVFTSDSSQTVGTHEDLLLRVRIRVLFSDDMMI